MDSLRRRIGVVTAGDDIRHWSLAQPVVQAAVRLLLFLEGCKYPIHLVNAYYRLVIGVRWGSARKL